MRHRLLSVTAVATATLLPALPATAAAGAVGTAATTSVPIHVEALGLSVDVGRTTLTASTDPSRVPGAPWSGVGVTLLDVDGATFGEVGARSDGTTSVGGEAIEQSTDVGAVSAAVADVFAVADDTVASATSAMTTLSTQVTVLRGLDVGAVVTDAVTSVDATGASATHTLAFSGVDLDLAHVLGSVLATLPLADLVAVADELGVTVPVDLDAAGGVVRATEDLLVAVAQAATAADVLDGAVGDLLAADDGRLDELNALLAAVGALDATSPTIVADLQAVLDAATFPAGCSITIGVVTPTVLSDLAACLEAEVAAHVASLAITLGAVEAAVADYGDAVAAALAAAVVLDDDASSLGAAVDDIATLVDDLLAADLLDVGPVEVSQQVRAVAGAPQASTASHVCSTTTVTPRGADAIEVLACEGTLLEEAVATIAATLGAVLDVVGAVDDGDGVELELFGTTADAVTTASDGAVTATSVLEVLRLTIPDVTVDTCAVTDDLVCSLGLDLDALLGDALTGVDGVLTGAQATAVAALDSAAPLLSDLGSTVSVAGLAGAQAVVDDAVGALRAAIDGLDLGIEPTPAGTIVRGATIVVDPQLEAEHVPVVAAGAPDPGDGGGDPTPASPSGDGPLPQTGGGAAALAVTALAAAALLRRGRRDDV